MKYLQQLSLLRSKMLQLTKQKWSREKQVSVSSYVQRMNCDKETKLTWINFSFFVGRSGGCVQRFSRGHLRLNKDWVFINVLLTTYTHPQLSRKVCGVFSPCGMVGNLERIEKIFLDLEIWDFFLPVALQLTHGYILWMCHLSLIGPISLKLSWWAEIMERTTFRDKEISISTQP